MATDKNGKLTYQMISPGEALNNFVNSKEGHNAAAVTPSYLDSPQQGRRPNVESKIAEIRADKEQHNSPGFANSIKSERDHLNQKDIEHDR